MDSVLAAIADVEDRRAAGDPRLAGWLADAAPEVRARAALALGRMGARRTLPALLPLLADADSAVRARAAFAAGLVGDSAALEPLGRLAADASAEVRRRAVEALSRLGSRRAAPLLGAALRDPAREVRAEAAVGLWRLQDSSAVDATLPLLADPDPGMRWRGVYALERSGSRRAPAAVEPLLADPDPTVRMMAARAAGRMKDPGAVEALGRALADPAWRVRVNAAAALGAVGDSAAGPALVRALSDSSGYVRLTAAAALGALRLHPAVPALQALERDTVAGCRQAAGVAVARTLGAGAFAACKTFLADSLDFVRAAVLEALGEGRCTAAWTFATWAAERGSPRVQSAALRYFGSIRDGAAIPMVLGALRGDDDLLAATAAQVLGDSGDSAHFEDLRGLYLKWPGEAHVDARQAAVEAAAKLWPERGARLFRLALDDPDPRVRASAAAGLKAAGLEAVPDSALDRPLPARRSGWFLGPPGARLPQAAVLRTSRGDIRIAFERDRSPNTVANFAALAARGYFDGLTWHRVVPNFVIQGGDPRGDGEGGPGYTIRCEMNELGYAPGAVGMALAGKDTGGSQFFITQSSQPHLNGRYTIFGRVEQGQDVVDRIQQGDRILSVRLME
ncbi:MAG TPA: HEAT repeat domain-containing protein [Candidatus Saccharimonadales bacterium]|nr:HEAT repeat domain-containing protein [Candidatus Saccharimonadales bacterium]